MHAPTDTTLAPVEPPPAVGDEPPIVVDDESPLPLLRTPVLATVTVIADDGWWSRDLVAFLGLEGFAVTLDPAGDSAFDHRSRGTDAAVIDLRLTARSATAVCVAWRRRSNAPIVAMTASREEPAVLSAFTAGADHVVMIDATPRQIVAHLRALLRRVPPKRGRSVPAAVSASVPVALGEDGRSAVVHGRPVKLTDEEVQMLSLFLDRPGRVVTRRELASTVVYASGSARAVDFFVRRLREKLEEVDTHRRIVVVRGVGFRFVVDGQPADASSEDS